MPLALVLFACIAYDSWAAGFAVFAVAAGTDWLDGWWARRFGPLSRVGRNLDPLTDKVLICGTFIYLLSVPATGVLAWMVCVIVLRELIITGIRGMVEATGAKFAADWFGKLKTALQCIAILFLLGRQALAANASSIEEVLRAVSVAERAFLYAALVATVGSGLQYLVKAARLLTANPPRN